jgi:hypothetical protein
MNAERVALEEARRILDTPLYADLGGDAEVSFEFFPPKTEKMEAQLWDSIEDAGAARPPLRLGHLRGGRIDAGAHAQHRRPHRA